MDIFVVKGIGTGQTLLSAFDGALKDAGVYNYNLIPLSSVIPPNAKIITEKTYVTPDPEYGHKLYVVKAEIRSNEIGSHLAAGVGWYQFGSDNRGVFVEHELVGDSKEMVETELELRIVNSLKDLCDNRNIEFDEDKIGSVISIAEVDCEATSALVLAVYKSEGWE